MLKKKKAFDEEPMEVAHRSISVTTVFVIVGLLFFVLVYALYFFRYNDLSPFYGYYNKPAADTTPLTSSVKIEVGKSKSGKTVEINITESELSSALCISCSSFPLKKSSAKIMQDGVVISGKTTNSFWGVGLEIVMKPKVEKGKVVFDLTDFKAAGVSAPPSITKTYSQNLKDAFSDLVPGANSINITEVHSLLGSLVFIGTKK